MGKRYVELAAGEGHRLINHGCVVLVCTGGEGGRYDVAPVAWTSPVRKEPAKMLVVLGQRHQTTANIRAKGRYIVAVPHASQAQLVRQCGSVSGREVDKYEQFGIEAFGGEQVDARVPAGCVGYLECELYERVEVEAVEVLVGQVLRAAVDEEAFDGRLLTERQADKTLGHLGGAAFCVPGDEVLGVEKKG